METLPSLVARETPKADSSHVSPLTRETRSAAAHLPAYGSIVAGTVLVGLAQPIFQCAPPLPVSQGTGFSQVHFGYMFV